MNYANYSTLKGKSKQAFKKIAAVAEVKDTFNSDGTIKKMGTSAKEAYVVLETKQYDVNTGEEKTASTSKINLGELENEKKHLTAEKARIQAQLTEVNKMITDIKKV